MRARNCQKWSSPFPYGKLVVRGCLATRPFSALFEGTRRDAARLDRSEKDGADMKTGCLLFTHALSGIIAGVLVGTFNGAIILLAGYLDCLINVKFGATTELHAFAVQQVNIH